MECSACKNPFKVDDIVVAADCGCLVHVFKVNCNEEDFCRKCNRKFHINSQSPLINMKANMPNTADNALEAFEKTLKELDEKFIKELESQKNNFNDIAEETLKKFQEQRKINLALMTKLNVLSKSHEDLIKMFHEQTLESKKVIDTLTGIITLELSKMKDDIINIQDDMENIYESLEM